MGTLSKKTDARLQQDVLEELNWDTRVQATDVGVSVQHGVVTLTGRVASYAARAAAEEAAHRVAGVLDVADDLGVELPGTHVRSDTDIARAVRSVLEWDVRVPHDRIRTTVSNGIVTLNGTVDYWAQLADAAQAVRNLVGVRGVANELEVTPAVSASHAGVHAAIEHALSRHAEHSAKHVKIAMADGKVILSGHVPSWAERIAVEGAARGTPGVRDVDNQLVIQM